MIGEWWCQPHGAYPETYVWVYYRSNKHEGNHYDRHMVINNPGAVQYVLWQLHGGTVTSRGTLYTPARWHWPPPVKPPKVHHKKALLKIWRTKHET